MIQRQVSKHLAGFIGAIASSAIAAPALAFDLAPPQPIYTTVGNPADAIVAPGSGYDGVVQLVFGNASCSGSLLGTGAHILTAAHCLPRASSGPADFFARATFNLASGSVGRSVSQFFLPSEWTGNWGVDAWNGYDLAILELTDFAPDEAERYDLYRDRNEVGQVAAKVGYGRSGTGATGSTFWDGNKRAGENRYDATGNETWSFASDRLLLYDFDSGLDENNFFGDLGLGAVEVISAPGDSGGPSFINGLIAGVTSWGTRSSRTDIDNWINSSYGEIGGDTRVSSHVNWIDAILNDWRQGQNPQPGDPPAKSVPEPELSLGLLFLTSWLLWQRRQADYTENPCSAARLAATPDRPLVAKGQSSKGESPS